MNAYGPEPDWSLGAAKAWLLERLEEGATCPCCTQFSKVYKRKINSTMARALITLYLSSDGEEFVHTATLPGDTHEMSQLSWWGLVLEERLLRPDGGRAGHWRLTHKGRLFVLGSVTVPARARVYDGRVLSLVGQQVTIEDCLGSRFNYTELMER